MKLFVADSMKVIKQVCTAGLHEDAYKTPKLVGTICDSHSILKTPYRYTDLETSSKFVNLCSYM